MMKLFCKHEFETYEGYMCVKIKKADLICNKCAYSKTKFIGYN